MQSAEKSSSRAARANRSMTDYLRILGSGFAMGVCEIIPGVSGGTMAFILGIYEELIESIRDVTTPEFITAVRKFQIKEIFEILNWRFLVTLLVGMLLAIFSLANVIGWLLENQPALLWSFFFGLVLASIWLVSQRLGRWTPTMGGLIVVMTIFSFWLVGLVPGQTANNPLILILSGAVAICAFILPGVSGSFILAVLGKYEYILDAVRSFDIVTVAFVGIGAALGLITFARVVSWLFANYHDTVVVVLMGFMIGSLRVIWPWKESLDFIDAHEAPRNMIPPTAINGAFNMEIVWAVLCLVAGMAAIILIERLGNPNRAESN